MPVSSIALRRGASFLTLGLALVLAACGSSAASNEGGGTVAVVNGEVTITADNLEFDANTITAPAGEAFTITLVNDDTAPHNISVYVSEGGDRIVLGEVINAGETVEIEVPALEDGTYYWVCDLHTNMDGGLIVGS